jgi:DNA recombination protein RmuC
MLELGWAIAFGTGFLLGVIIMQWIGWMKRGEARQMAAELLNQAQTDRIRDLEAVIERLKESFAAISYDALNKNSVQFLNLAGETLKNQAQMSEQNLETKKVLIDQTLEAIGKEMGKVHEVVNQLEKDREQKFGEINAHLKNTAEQTARLQETTQHLKSILANTRIRGQWGERMAEDVLRMSGLIEGINYRKQQYTGLGSRPDYTFFLPKNLKVNMDVKFPLDNYLLFLQMEDQITRDSYKQQFLKDVKNRIKEVTTRDYINAEDNTVDYVLVFIPNEQVYGFINEMDGTLLDEAIKNRVILCSPLSLYAYLAVIRQAVESFNLEKTTSQILSLIGGFYRQWDAFCATFDKMGRRIEETRNEYLALTTTRRHQLEKPLRMIEDLRKQNRLPIETLETAVLEEESEEPPAI